MTDVLRGPGHRLDAQQRATLAALIAERPDHSAGRIALTFQARTGRKIDRRTVQDLRNQGGYKVRPANSHLSPAEREILTFLVLEGDEGRAPASCREVARQFTELAGRPIHPSAVWDHRVKALGLPRVGAGKGPKPRRKEVP